MEVKTILVSQPQPESEKSPYYGLSKSQKVKIDFRSFIHVEDINAQEFRKDRVALEEFEAVIFTSRNAVDHFFRLCEEMRIKMPAETNYFCLSETIANYLQNALNELIFCFNLFFLRAMLHYHM